MAQTKTLLLTGGEIHDYKGCGVEIEKALRIPGDFDITHVDNDLNILASPELKNYDSLVLYFTVGELNSAQRDGLMSFVAEGKGFVGIHSAADSFHNSEEYRSFIGGHFITHPAYRTYQVSVLDREHPITEGLDEFMVTDEQYITSYDSRLNILATALWQGIVRPVAWTRPWGKGRVFYLALGHDPAACQNEHFQLLLQRGTRWAAGKL